MRDNFAVFILSHERCNNIKTLQLLIKTKFKGQYYIVIDSEDKQIEEYKKTIPQDNLLIFNKQKLINLYDSMILVPKLSSAMWARNFIVDYAKNNQYDYIAMIDDDISNLAIRYPLENSLKTFNIKDINQVFDLYVEFLNSSDTLMGISPANACHFIGGLNGAYKTKLQRRMYQFMILKVKGIKNFRGTYLEDEIYFTENFSKLYLYNYDLCYFADKFTKSEGGIEYSSMLDAKLFYKIFCGEKYKLYETGKSIIKRDNFFPKILSNKYKKE